MEQPQKREHAVSLRGLTKRFGQVVANSNVKLTLRRGEILAILGENGSGKTTLMNMISGIYMPDEGMMKINGKEVTIRSPKDAIRLGIGMIHQHFKLVEVMTARENILLGMKPLPKGTLEGLLERFGLKLDLDKKVYDMSVSEKQTVEIVKVLSRGADILILDEPTAVLTPQETDRLFDILREMKRQGHAVVIITHKLGEVMAISDRVTILRKGESIDTVETDKTSVNELTEMMVGRPISLNIDRVECERGEPILDVHQLSVKSNDGAQRLSKVSFCLHEGEILGVAGVAGSGQKELCEAIAGLQPIEGGSILLEGKNVGGLPAREIIKRGVSMSFIPEDRLGMGLVGSMNLVDNMLLKTYAFQKGPILHREEARKLTRRLIDTLSISTPSPYISVAKLSGGNVQKVLLGREIDASPRVLITAYPVRGLDIGSSMTIYDLLMQQKQKGVGVLYIGEDLDVLIELCDRIMVLCQGRVTAVVDAHQVTKEQLGLYMTGAEEQEVAMA